MTDLRLKITCIYSSSTACTALCDHRGALSNHRKPPTPPSQLPRSSPNLPPFLPSPSLPLTHQVQGLHSEQQCPLSMEAELCARWAGLEERSCGQAEALIGGSPPLDSGKVWSRKEQSQSTKFEFKLYQCRYTWSAFNVLTHMFHNNTNCTSISTHTHTRTKPCSVSPGRENCSTRHPFCSTAMNIIINYTIFKINNAPLTCFKSSAVCK